MPARGTTVELTGLFETAAGNPTDVTDAELNIFHGDDLVAGPITDLENPIVGTYVYEYTIPLDAPIGTHHAVWQGILPGGASPTYGSEDFEVTSFFTAPGYTGCEWPLDTSCLEAADWDDLPEEAKAKGAALAGETLHRMTAHRVGGCPITVRPLVTQNRCLVMTPGIDGSGIWRNVTGGPSRSIQLPAPIGRVDEVKVDGVVVDAMDYEVVSGKHLTWMGAEDPPWPLWQDVTLPDSLPGTFSVTYLNAYPPDSIAAQAAGVLASEFAKACAGAKKCRLPEGTIAVVRRGVSIQLQQGLFREGFTGIREVDAFISLWNPKNRSRVTVVHSPTTMADML